MTPLLLLSAIFGLLLLYVGHFSEDVNAGTALKLSFSSGLVFYCF